MKKLLVPGLLITAAAVLVYGGRQLYLLYKAAVKIVNVKINSISTGNISLVLYAELINKGDISAVVKNQHYDVFLNNVIVSTIDSRNEIHVNSNGKTILPININFSPDKTLSIGLANLSNLLIDRAKVVLEIKGYLSLTSGPITLNNFLVNIKYTLQELIDMSKEQRETQA